MKIQNETGRSMVEMLAVIAIMGIISLGGIAGYTLAVNRNSATRLLDVAAKLAGMGTGGTEFKSLKAAGMDISNEFPGVDMKLNLDGTVCVVGLSGDLQEAFEAKALSFLSNKNNCAGILLDFQQR